MPYDYNFSASFIEARNTFIRVAPLDNGCRYYPVRDAAGMITSPTLDPGVGFVELHAVQDYSPNITDRNNPFRVFGDSGWEDSRITGKSWSASIRSYFMRNSELPSTGVCPVFNGDYEEGFALIERARRYKDVELFVEIYLLLGQTSNETGNFIYDYTAGNVSIQNYRPTPTPDGMMMAGYDMVGRSECFSGRFDAGSTPLRWGGLQSGLLTTAASSGTRRYTVSPADQSIAAVTTTNVTVTYTSDGTLALTQLGLVGAGDGFRLENVSSGARIPCAVTLNTTTGVVTIDPVSTLSALTTFRLTVPNGAITQTVDNTGTASAGGVRRSLQGFQSVFRTA
jgi:hypothetical protein